MLRGRMRVWVAAATTALLIIAVAADNFAGRPRAFDPDMLSDAGRGVVIEGICPADVRPVQVDSAYTSSDWAIKGTAYPGLTVIRWEVPDIRDLEGYVVARLSYGHDWQLDPDSKRIFAVSDIGNHGDDYAAFADSEEVSPGTRFWYRVFPIVAGELGWPSPPLDIWTPPEKPPLTPSRVNVARKSNGGIEVYARSGFHEWLQDIRVVRRELGATDWQVVHDPPPPQGFDWEIREHHRWLDEDVEPGKEYEYAVCQTNARGASKAMIADTAPTSLDDVPVDPPRNIRAVQSPYAITVFWEQSEDTSVVGYKVERVGEGDGDKHAHDRIKTVRNRAENFVDYSFRSMPENDTHRFRVRALTAEGVGTWSNELVVATNRSEGVNDDHPRPMIERLSAIHDVVHLVWSVGAVSDDTSYRFLRRDVSRRGEWEFFHYRFGGRWVHEDEFDWDFVGSLEWDTLGWTDEVGLRPDTEYEYAVQLKRGDKIEPPSVPMRVQTGPLPETNERLPVIVHDLGAELKNDGVQLTWTLPTDPTLKGLLVSETVYDHDVRWANIHYTPLAPITTRYYFRHASALGGYAVCYFVQPFNDYGMQDLMRQATCLDAGEPNDCRPTGEYIRDDGNPTIDFNGCDAMSTYVVRHELTLDGFDTKAFIQPCRPFKSEWGYECEFEDDDVKPSTWYLYDLRQVSKNGEVSASVHEFLTRPERVR